MTATTGSAEVLANAEKSACMLKAIHLRVATTNDWRLSEDEHEELDVAYDAILKCAAAFRLAAKPAEDVRASSLVVAWNSYVRLFGEPPHGTEKQLRALLRLVPSTTGQQKP